MVNRTDVLEDCTCFHGESIAYIRKKINNCQGQAFIHVSDYFKSILTYANTIFPFIKKAYIMISLCIKLGVEKHMEKPYFNKPLLFSSVIILLALIISCKMEENYIVNADTPSITIQPQATTSIPRNSTAVLSVTADRTDDGTLSYQWYSNDSAEISGGMSLLNATPSYFTIPSAEAGTFYYYCMVTNTISDNGDGGIKTASATTTSCKVDVTVVNAAAPAILTQPAAATTAARNSSVTLSVSAACSDEGSLSYQWYASS